MCDMGLRQDVMRTAFAIVDQSGRDHPFSNGLAGRRWFDGFRSRHPNLTMRIAQPLSYSQVTAANKETIHNLFAKLGALCAHLNLLSKLIQIFNAGISIVHRLGK